jgi:uncharacterized protein
VKGPDQPLKRRLITRRRVLAGLGSMAMMSGSVAAYGIGSAALSERVTSYKLTPPGWTPGLQLKFAIISDIHACEPWMGVARLARIVEDTNGLGVDAVLLLGDYIAGRGMNRFATEPMPDKAWASELAKLRAPLGVHAVFGNHDWWEDKQAMRARMGPTRAHRALDDVGIATYENKAIRLVHNSRPFWLAGLGDQWAFPGLGTGRRPDGRRKFYMGVDDLAGTLAQIKDDAPVVLMAHEPDIFPEVPARVSLTISGHTHGGQIQIAGFAPVVPSAYGRRYRYGHIVENGRHLLVSAGLGCSGMPVRIGSKPEIVLLELGSDKS